MTERIKLNDGYYFESENVRNGLGGFHPINLTLKNDALKFSRKITDANGYFIDFPGVVDGEWQEDLKSEFRPQMKFMFSWNSFKNGLLEFFWTVQPDGRYYADDDGFGMEDDVEIRLKSHLDKNGDFTEPFAPV